MNGAFLNKKQAYKEINILTPVHGYIIKTFF